MFNYVEELAFLAMTGQLFAMHMLPKHATAVMFSSFGLAPHFSAAIYSQLAEVLPPRISLPNSGLSMVLWG